MLVWSIIVMFLSHLEHQLTFWLDSSIGTHRQWFVLCQQPTTLFSCTYAVRFCRGELWADKYFGCFFCGRLFFHCSIVIARTWLVKRWWYYICELFIVSAVLCFSVTCFYCFTCCGSRFCFILKTAYSVKLRVARFPECCLKETVHRLMVYFRACSSVSCLLVYVRCSKRKLDTRTWTGRKRF